MNSIHPDLYRDMKTILNQKGGKKGGIYLQGKPSTGKSIIVKLFYGAFDTNDIGIISRADEKDKFWLQDIKDKLVYVAEEMVCTDKGADDLKMLLEGHELFSFEMKNRGRFRQSRRPIILTSNFHLTCMCPRQWNPLKDRLFTHYAHTIVPTDHIMTQLYTMDRQELKELCEELFFESP